MSHKNPSRIAATHRACAPVFAALGDSTRLFLIARLSRGGPRSIAELTRGSRLTRQAITKHLCVLENAGVVRSVRRGRENQFEFHPAPMIDLKSYLESVSQQWGRSLTRLRLFVER